MSEDNKSIAICHDCGIRIIKSKKLLEYGRCNSCQLRFNWANRTNSKYIPMLKMDRDKLENQINYIYNSQGYQKMSKFEKMRLDIIKSNIDTINKLKIPKISDEEYDSINDKSNNKDNLVKDDVIEYIKRYADNNILVSHMLKLVREEYPDLNMQDAKIRYIYKKYNLPYKRCYENREKLNKLRENDESPENNKASLVEEIDNQDNTKTTINKVDNISGISSDIQEDRLIEQMNSIMKKDIEYINVDIRQEIQNNIIKLFKDNNCIDSALYNVTDYINSFTMITCVLKNHTSMVRNRVKQYKLIQLYQLDILHEIENSKNKEELDKASAKLHVIRKYRRYIKLDIQNINTIRRDLIKNGQIKIDLERLEKVINALKLNQETIENPIFIPRVDHKLSDEYDWAKTPQELEQLIATSENQDDNCLEDIDGEFTENNISNDNLDSCDNCLDTVETSNLQKSDTMRYKVSCVLHGSIFEPGSVWEKVYARDISRASAVMYSKNTLSQLQSKYEGTTYSDFKIEMVEINIKTNITKKPKIYKIMSNSKLQSIVKDLGNNYEEDSNIKLDQIKSITGKVKYILSYSTPDTIKVKSLLKDEELNKGIHCYMVSCAVSGGGFSIYTPLRKVYIASSMQQAEEASEKELNNLKSNIKGTLITGYKIFEINKYR